MTIQIHNHEWYVGFIIITVASKILCARRTESIVLPLHEKDKQNKEKRNSR